MSEGRVIEPFRLQVDDAVLDDLRERLARTRLPSQLDDAGWEYGCDTTYLAELIAYWRDAYDWRAQEARLNEFPQYMTTASDGSPLHFLHVRSPHPEAVPLLLCHGWPATPFEFQKIIGPLVDPPGHGGRAEDAFHVVAPAMPGYPPAGPTRSRGWGVRKMAEEFVDLMGDLGYERFLGQGGDWGHMVVTFAGLTRPEQVRALHLNLCAGYPPADEDPATWTPTEAADVEHWQHELRWEMGYAEINSTKPDSIGIAHNDSPAGLAAWFVEKFRAWSDCDGEVEARFSKDELLTNVMLYWVTETAASAARIYWETRMTDGLGPPPEPLRLPTGISIFPADILRSARRWAEPLYPEISFWNRHDRGGHFAAMEEPSLLVTDIRECLRPFRGQTRSTSAHQA